MTNLNTAIIKIAGLYICYHKDDHAYTYALTDQRAKEVSENDTPLQYAFGEVNPDDAYKLHGIGIFSAASIFFWSHKLDFDYIDVGANVGMTTIAQAVFYKRCGRHNRVYAFEPGEIFFLLQKSVGINKIDDMTTCIRVAASDQAGKVAFHVTPAQSPASSLLSAAVNRPGIEVRREIVVDAITLDSFVTNHLRPAPALLVKIDAEGADFRVLKGMRETLAKRLCAVQIEFFPSLLETYTNPVAELIAMKDHFEIIAIEDRRLMVLDPTERGFAGFIERTKSKAMPASDVLFVSKKIPSYEALAARILQESE